MKRATQATSAPEAASMLERAFAILAILPTDDGIPLAEVASRASLPKPTTHRILRALINLGQVIQDERTRSYRSSGRLTVPSTPSWNAIREAALPRMKRLHKALDETVNLGVRDGAAVRYLHVIESTRPLRLTTIPDAVDPLHSTALGRMLLAGMDPRQAAVVLAGSAPTASTAKTIVDPIVLERIVHAARRRGYAEECEENDIGVACIAVPLRATPWVHDAAISITVPTPRFTVARRREIIATLNEVVP